MDSESMQHEISQTSFNSEAILRLVRKVLQGPFN